MDAGPDGLARGIHVAASKAGWLAKPFAHARGLSSAEFSQRFLGVDPGGYLPHVAPPEPRVPIEDPPDEFDWRTVKSTDGCIGPVVDQSPVDANGTQQKCGSCWAVSAVETLSDRRCISMRNRTNETDAPRVELSALDLIACDRECQHLHEQCNQGCLGGYPVLAWEYFEATGVVSAECMPYNLSKQLLCPVPKCHAPISSKAYYTRRHYQPVGVTHIRAELVARGPVQATFTVYEDFMAYAGGVYVHIDGRKLGLHAVKVIGYGVTPEGVHYWTAMNSWGPAFGLNGTFMIAEGECGFENAVLAGDPCLPGDPYPCHS